MHATHRPRLVLRWLGLLALALAACATVSQAPTTMVSAGTVITDVTVVNTRDGSLRPGMTVVLAAGKIERIAPSASVQVGSAAQRVDGRGKYIVPGYLDMHTHALPMALQGHAPWPLMLAHGITGIREMVGSLSMIRLAREMNEQLALGTATAPEVLQVPGDLFLGVTSAALAKLMVREQKEMGADFIKIVNADRDTTLTILAAAQAHGLKVAGHLSPVMGAAEASQAGWHAIEHLGSGFGMLLDCAADAAAIRQSLANGEGARSVLDPKAIASPLLFRALDAPLYQRAIDSYREDQCQALAKTTAQAGTWQVPTLIRLRTMAFSADPLYRNDLNLRYVDKTRKALWEQLAQQYVNTVPLPAAQTFQKYYGMQQRLVGVLKQNGARMLTGSDLGGIWVIPGVGLHQEFAELAAAGLSPLEVLQATTLNGAIFMQREATMGTVEEGKNADLVLLDANPLERVANLGAIAGVFLRGQYFSQTALEGMKRKVEMANHNAPLRDVASVLDHSHRH